MRPLIFALALLAASCASQPPAVPSPSAAKATPVAPAASSEPVLDSWANGAVFYEVFVRSFADTNGDGKGDLKGLIARLDYLNDGNPATDTDLGVDALWLMPVFASPSYHGYDTTDYDNINPDYGTNDDFTKLCAEAHRRGMKVIVDLVLNHTSSKHPWFVDSASSPTSPKRDWYVWSPTDPGWGQPWKADGQSWHASHGAFYYGVFWGGMPDLNFKNDAVRTEAKRIASEWLDRGVDGYRLDATRHLIETGPGDTGQSDTPETHAFLKEFAAHVRKAKPEAILIGENWTETPIIAKYYGDTRAVPGGDELPLSFSFPLATKIIASARQGEASLVAEKIAEMQKVYPPGATWVPFLTNHDMKRVASNLKNDPGQLRMAAAVMLTLPGAPFIYYGEEIGMQNGPNDDDEWKRTPMPWDETKTHGFTTGKPWQSFAPGSETANVAAETKDPASLLSHYRRLIRLRHASRAIQRGRLELLTTEGPILAYLVTEGAERVLVAHNLGDQTAGVAVAATGAATPLLAPEGGRFEDGHISLAGRTTAAWKLSPVAH